MSGKDLFSATVTVDDKIERINLLLDQQEDRIADVFRTAIGHLKNDIDLDELTELLARGRIDAAFDRLQDAADKLGEAVNVAFVSSGKSTAEFMQTAGLGAVVFDQTNWRAVSAMQQSKLELVKDFTNEQRKAVSAALISGVESGINPIAQARNFRDAIGLTTSQWDTVARYRKALESIGTGDAAQSAAALAAATDKELRYARADGQITRAAVANKPLPADKIDELVTRYSNNFIRYRSNVIGRTEALRAVHEGQENAYAQAIEAGEIGADQIERTWRTHLDGKERISHHALNGEARGWGETWQGLYGELRYPGDPEAPAKEVIQCRCALLYRLILRMVG